jgi:hypothetical protein
LEIVMVPLIEQLRRMRPDDSAQALARRICEVAAAARGTKPAPFIAGPKQQEAPADLSAAEVAAQVILAGKKRRAEI